MEYLLSILAMVKDWVVTFMQVITFSVLNIVLHSFRSYEHCQAAVAVKVFGPRIYRVTHTDATGVHMAPRLA